MEPSEWCVYRNEVHHTAKEKNVVLQVGRGQRRRELWEKGQGGFAVGEGGGVRERAAQDGRVGVQGSERWLRVGQCSRAAVCGGSGSAAVLPILLQGAPRCPVLPQDVRSDPTLPRTKDVRCPQCNHNEAVFFSAHTEEVRPAHALPTLGTRSPPFQQGHAPQCCDGAAFLRAEEYIYVGRVGKEQGA